MMDTCNTPDIQFPMKADVFYPIVEQGAYGNTQKKWVLDKTISCYFGPLRKKSEEVKPNVNITLNQNLLGRVKSDIRISSKNNMDAITNVVITNIRTAADENIYLETAGPRAGRATIYEIESQSPFLDPYGDIQHYTLTVRRSENQATDL